MKKRKVILNDNNILRINTIEKQYNNNHILYQISYIKNNGIHFKFFQIPNKRLTT